MDLYENPYYIDSLGYPVLALSFSRILAHLSFLFMTSLVIMEGRHASLETPACVASFAFSAFVKDLVFKFYFMSI
jgi:hypothetical protein